MIRQLRHSWYSSALGADVEAMMMEVGGKALRVSANLNIVFAELTSTFLGLRRKFRAVVKTLSVPLLVLVVVVFHERRRPLKIKIIFLGKFPSTINPWIIE